MAVASARIPSAWPLRGTWWGSPALVLSPGTGAGLGVEVDLVPAGAASGGSWRCGQPAQRLTDVGVVGILGWITPSR